MVVPFSFHTFTALGALAGVPVWHVGQQVLWLINQMY